jgi:gamma-glutamylcyclotransferase (GGCT)/AIG2-like uncharacterized protein YtfP
MTDQITLEQALKLVDFDQFHDGSWFVKTVKGDCDTVKGECYIVEGDCGTVEGDCHSVRGRVLTTINGRQWQYVETRKGKMSRLIEEGAAKEELLKALEELPND